MPPNEIRRYACQMYVISHCRTSFSDHGGPSEAGDCSHPPPMARRADDLRWYRRIIEFYGHTMNHIKSKGSYVSKVNNNVIIYKVKIMLLIEYDYSILYTYILNCKTWLIQKMPRDFSRSRRLFLMSHSSHQKCGQLAIADETGKITYPTW